jgi:hypothetical protein
MRWKCGARLRKGVSKKPMFAGMLSWTRNPSLGAAS